MENLTPDWLYSHSHYHYLRDALPKRAFYKYSPSGPNLIHKIRRYNRLYAEYRMTPPSDAPGARVSDERAKKQLNVLKEVRGRMTDLDADVLDILFGIWLDRRREIEKFVEVDTDEILYARGLKHKVNGQKTNTRAIGRGYTPQQREAVNRSICRLLLLWGEVKVIHGHNEEDFNGESRVLELKSEDSGWSELASRPFENNDEEEGLQIQKRQPFRYRPGTIFRHFNLRQRMYHPPKIYNYNYRRHWREKRLSRYLMWQWRVNQKHRTSPLIKSTASLVNAAVLNLDRSRFDQAENDDVFDIKPEYRPEGSDPSYRRRERFERTLNRLAEDEIIGDWDYYDGWKRSWSQKSNWTDLWLNSEIVIHPSEGVAEAYQGDEEDSEDPHTAQQKPISTLLTEVKDSNDLTQDELGEAVGLSQPYISAIINGRRTPSVASAKELREKLRSMIDEN